MFTPLTRARTQRLTLLVPTLSLTPRSASLIVRTPSFAHSKMVPLLNPDGVAAGHFRQDSYGNNLNRHYVNPDAEKHSSVYAARAVVMHHATRPAGRY